jgi:hypothetical protein
MDAKLPVPALLFLMLMPSYDFEVLVYSYLTLFLKLHFVHEWERNFKNVA